MDSLTQIVLGAACGEAVAGKKLGNRAMIWGAVGGTIPDLDVLSNWFLDPLDAMMFHRGPMHSLLFASILPLLAGPLVKKLYDRNWHRKKTWQWVGYGVGLLLYVAAAVLASLIAGLVSGTTPWPVIAFFAFVGLGFFFLRYKQVLADRGPAAEPVGVGLWRRLFFWSVFTHPLLDALTTYGTQLFWPFDNMRVQISSISIVDPLYTVPFGLMLLGAALHRRDDPGRRRWVMGGIAIASIYLMLTFAHKLVVDHKFRARLNSEAIATSSRMSTPSILNNALWYAIARTDTGFIAGYYSIFDRGKPFDRLVAFPSNHHFGDNYRDDLTLQQLAWFSGGYYRLERLASDTLLFSDLRFGSLGGRPDDPQGSVFTMKLVDLNGRLEMVPQGRPRNRPEDVAWFRKRIFGSENTNER
ncbi:MAG: metal-dependent hydrolase [Saprospiraceae bacterium]|jgi:inner membrane protein|nr:metal-dependent hydrolase [Saprospiraceae bacterium]MBP9210489.1 metal-dependent hydrolase [Saprospiraceae bacterium]MBV6472587.1 hypothetical protein [Saprospiraceae bacterium]